MPNELPKNGVLMRTLSVGGLLVSEVDFWVEEGWPRCLGYMVGEDDGHSTLHPTPAEAVAAYQARSPHPA